MTFIRKIKRGNNVYYQEVEKYGVKIVLDLFSIAGSLYT